jgi:excisionase family DNA binding protein
MDTQEPETRAHEEPSKVWLTVPEAADELRIPRTRCYELIQRGELPAVRIGERSIRVNRAELVSFLLENRRVASSARK